MTRKGTKKTFGEEIIGRLQEFADALDAGAVISEEFTCRTAEVTSKPNSYQDDQSRRTRELLHASQIAFSQLLGVSVQTVRAWEQGENETSGIAKRFMDEIRHDPEYWRKRLREIAVPRRKKTA